MKRARPKPPDGGRRPDKPGRAFHILIKIRLFTETDPPAFGVTLGVRKREGVVDPFTALGAWSLALIGVAALVRAARNAAMLPDCERNAFEAD